MTSSVNKTLRQTILIDKYKTRTFSAVLTDSHINTFPDSNEKICPSKVRGFTGTNFAVTSAPGEAGWGGDRREKFDRVLIEGEFLPRDCMLRTRLYKLDDQGC